MSRIMIVVEYDVKPAHLDDFIKLMKTHAELSRQEDGCEQFDLIQARDNPAKVFFVEAWRDQAALDMHMKVPRMTQSPSISAPWRNERKVTFCSPV